MTCLRILVEQVKFMVVYAILLALNISPANKCQHKFQPGVKEIDSFFLLTVAIISIRKTACLDYKKIFLQNFSCCLIAFDTEIF